MEGAGSAGIWLFAGHLLTVWGVALSNILLGLAFLYTMHQRRRLPWHRLRESPLFVPVGFYLLLLLTSIATSPDPRLSAKDLGEVFSFLTLPLALLWIRGESRVRWIHDLLILMVLGLALHGFWQYFYTDAGPLSHRIRGLFSHYMTFSGVLLVGFSLSLAGLTSKQGVGKVWRWLALVAIGSTLFLTQTRSAWLAALVVLALVLWMHIKSRSLPVLVSLVLVGAFLYPLAPTSWQARIDSVVDLRDPSNYDRLCMAEAASYMISERPFFGLGPGMVSRLYPLYRHPSAPRNNVPHLHSTMLQMAAERGLLALATYLWLVVVSGRCALRGYRRSRAAQASAADLYLGVILALVGFHVAGLFEANWNDSEVQRLVLFLLAVPFCLQEGEESPAVQR